MRGWVAGVIGVTLVAVATGGSLAAAPAKEPTCAPEGTALTISAKDTKFNKDCLMAPTGQAFTIAFENKESVPHNVAIYDERDGKKTIFKGEVFIGPKTVTYAVPAIPEEGYYRFTCDPHNDTMNGVFVVGSPAPTTTTTKAPPPTTSTTAGLLPKIGG